MNRRRGLDKYQKKAKKDGYRSRAAYKLLAIQEKFHVLKLGDFVLDLCGAPGGFSQVAQELVGTKGKVLLVDIQTVKNLPNIECLQMDITKDEVKEKLVHLVDSYSSNDQIDVILADCSVNVTGNWSLDHNRQIWLAENVLDIAIQMESEITVCKVFMGEYFDEFTNRAKKYYKSVRYYKPKASRKKSAEIYLIARFFKEK